MPLRASRFTDRALLAVWLGLTPAVAAAQACCSGASAITPGRLALHEDILAGAAVKAADQLGSYTPAAAYVGASRGAYEVDLEQDVFASARLFDRAQLSLLLPVVETYRAVPALSDFGGGLGDLNLSGRYDFIDAGESLRWPGLAVLVGVTAPTGRPPEKATGVLASDSTGIGTWQFTLGAAAEQTFGRWLVNVSALATERLSRSVDGVHELLGPQFTFLVAGGYAFENEMAVALVASYVVELAATIDGQPAPGTEHQLPSLTLSCSTPLGESFRLQASVGDTLWPSLGRNQPAGLTLAVTLVRVWT